MEQEDESLESLTCGGLSILQKKNGYRFSLDAYLLSAFVEEPPDTPVLEIGSGSGVIAILLAAMKGLRVLGVEIQDDVAEMSRRSVSMNRLDDRAQIISADINTYSGKKAHAVVANPPYRPLCTGRVNPEAAKAIARHEIKLDLDGLLENASRLLTHGGRFYCIYPAWRLADIMQAMRLRRLEPKRLMMVHSTLEQPAQLCLIKGIKGGGRELSVDAPFAIYTSQGNYTDSMSTLFTTLQVPKIH